MRAYKIRCCVCAKEIFVSKLHYGCKFKGTIIVCNNPKCVMEIQKKGFEFCKIKEENYIGLSKTDL
jgi:hypothetical protein